LSTLRRNIVANIAGGGLIAGLNLVAIPLQLKILGVGAYGLVGLITTLQVALSALDLGLSATATRLVASERDNKSNALSSVITSMVTIFWIMAVGIAATFYFLAPWVATNWLKGTTVQADIVTNSLRLMAIYVALRWPVSIYAGLITGVERLDVLNVLKTTSASLRLLGGIAVLLAGARLEGFLLWFAISGAIEVIAYAITAHALVPSLKFRPRISVTALRGIWTFSLSMNLIALSSLLLTQLDRLVISTLLSLEALGYYTLAYTAAHGISLLQVAVNGASFPAFSRATREAPGMLRSRYLKTTELMAYCYALPCCALLFFTHEILSLWIDHVSADRAFVALIVIEVGFFLNAMVSSSYLVALACGQPKVPLKVNAVAIALYVPLLYLMVATGGILGAAFCWLALNVYYWLTLLPIVSASFLGLKVSIWLRQAVVPFVIAGTLVFGLMKVLASAANVPWLACASLGAILYSVIGYLLLSRELRATISAAIPTRLALRL
jgi:O-antigen/teichoic acid export membrane protein